MRSPIPDDRVLPHVLARVAEVLGHVLQAAVEDGFGDRLLGQTRRSVGPFDARVFPLVADEPPAAGGLVQGRPA